ncbi:MAG: acetyl-CoA carboxylase biotin carboxylase subunit family protein [Bacteroidia bacterium]
MNKKTILCLASYFKGIAFMKAAHARGWRVLVVTSEELKDDPWPHDAIEEMFYMPGPKDEWDMKTLIEGMNHLMLRTHVDKIVALDDFDVERAANLREHFRIGGMGDTRARYFRDKLAMRLRAEEAGVPCPAFIKPFHHDDINQFIETVPAPWILKPRTQASATGITKFENRDDLWAKLDELGEARINYVLEQFIPGDVYHIDSVAFEGEVVFAKSHKYMSPPFAVAHGGGIFRTHSLAPTSKDNKDLIKLNAHVSEAFGMKSSAMHTEFLKAHDTGKWYFIETASRVGGAHIAELLEAYSGVNLWAEWAKIETLEEGETYKAPKAKAGHGGLIISLARQQHPDTSSFDDPEIAWRITKDYHIGLIVQDKKLDRVTTLLDNYAERVLADFHASAPAADAPTS